jgi:hypothetical protein
MKGSKFLKDVSNRKKVKVVIGKVVAEAVAVGAPCGAAY